MPRALVDLVLSDHIWPLGSLLLALAVVAIRIRKHAPPIGRSRVVWAMNTMYGCFLGTMACGHLLAVTLKLTSGTLRGSPAFLYPLGLVLAIPAWWLVFRVSRHDEDDRSGKTIVALNAWLAICLFGAGLANLPLALFAVLNIVYVLNHKQAVERVVPVFAAIAYVALLIGSTIFLASGQNFEKFSGMR